MVHIRRRLTAVEAALVGVVRDIRGTDEERERLAVVLAAVDPRTRERMMAMQRGDR